MPQGPQFEDNYTIFARNLGLTEQQIPGWNIMDQNEARLINKVISFMYARESPEAQQSNIRDYYREIKITYKFI